MISKLTIEQAKRLRNDFECWQQDYNPKDDKEQYDMFGRGIAAMDMLIAGMYQEPVVWVMLEDLADKNIVSTPAYPDINDAMEMTHGELEPLYRHAQQPVVGYVPLGDSPYDVPHSMPSNLRELIAEEIGILFSDDDAQSVWDVCRRAAMFQAGTLTNEDTRQVDELTMWIKRLVRSLKKASPDSKLHSEAMDYLTAKGLISVGDALR